jgi:hypothetical protein
MTAWFDAASETAEYGVVVIGVALLVTGVGSSITAVRRLVKGYRGLAREDEPADGKAAKRESLREKTL